MDQTLENIQKWILYIVVALFAVFTLPQFASPFVIAKEAFLTIGICLFIVLWIVRFIAKGATSFSIGKFDLGVILVAVAYLASTFVKTPNKMEAYLFPGTTTFILAGALLYFLINQFDKKIKEGISWAVFVSSILLSLTILATELDLFSKIPQLPAFVRDTTFNTLGGSVPSAIYLVVFLPLTISLILHQKDIAKKFFVGVSAALMLFSAALLVYHSLPGKLQSPRFVSLSDSWAITVETLKASPIFGSGPANYLTAFNLYRPLSYNASDLWQVRFTTASNFYLTALTELGFAGLAAFAILLIAIYKFVVFNFKPSPSIENISENLGKLSLVLIVVLFAVFPIAPTLVIILFITLALLSHSEERVIPLKIDSSSKAPAIIIGIPFLLGVAAVMFFGGKVLAAEATFKKSLDALTSNDAQKTYDLMSRAINQNPNVDRYHASLAQVEMALATSIANKKSVTDSDKQTITQLVQSAINEGKATVALNPQRSGNWEILAQIYRTIMPYAQGADQFTVQTYTQAIALDPTNPNLRISLGGVYYALGRFDDAIDTFKLAVLAKPNFANAHYNLAIAYREKKDYADAITEMKNVLSLVDKSSNDYTTAQSVLSDLEKNQTTQTQNSTNLQAPQPAQTSNIKPPITLPQEATPPATNR